MSVKVESACSHGDWVPAGYPEGDGVLRAQSNYEVYCQDCKNYVNLFTGDIINDKGLEIDYCSILRNLCRQKEPAVRKSCDTCRYSHRNTSDGKDSCPGWAPTCATSNNFYKWKPIKEHKTMTKYKVLKKMDLISIARAGDPDCKKFKTAYLSLFRYMDLQGRMSFELSEGRVVDVGVAVVIRWAEENRHIEWFCKVGFLEKIEEFEPVFLTLTSQSQVDKLYALMKCYRVIDNLEGSAGDPDCRKIRGALRAYKSNNGSAKYFSNLNSMKLDKKCDS